jgi:chemotaxis signal transduction protein
LLFGADRAQACLSTRIVVVSDGYNEQGAGTKAANISAQGQPGSRRLRPETQSLLGLLGENVSELTTIRPAEIMPLPIPDSQATLFTGIVQTEHGLVQILAIERIREKALAGHILNQGEIHRPTS